MSAPAPRPPAPPAAGPARTSVVPYFQVHQPFRLRRYTYFDIGVDARWFDDAENERIVRRVAERCYVPANALLVRLVHETEGRFRCAVSVSGTALEQMERWAPEALDGFVALARTGCVEVLGETSHHSLAFLADDDEPPHLPDHAKPTPQVDTAPHPAPAPIRADASHSPPR